MDIGLDVVGVEYLYVPGSPLAWGFLGALSIAAFVLVARAVGAVAGALITSVVVGAYILIGDFSLPVAVVLAALGAWYWRRCGRPLARRSPRRAGFEVLAILAAYTVYEIARIHTEGTFEAAHANALRVVDFEQSLGLFFERSLQEPFLGPEPLLRGISFVYSYLFLAFITAVTLWLFLVDDRNFRLMRDALGASCVLAVMTMWMFPTAPPRLVPEVDIIDTVVLLGREHDFANEFAAIPSLHVGWTALAGYVLGRSIGGRRGLAIMPIPGAAMAFTVVVTGNHWWVDGFIGALFTLGPAFAVVYLPRVVTQERLGRVRGALVNGATGVRRQLSSNTRVQLSVLALSGLLTYMLVEQYLNPGFTDHWGYLVSQTVLILALLLIFEVVFEKEGGLTWQTHGIAVSTTFADTLGTDGNLYARFDEYDKLVHFFGTAAVTSTAFDLLHAVNIRRGGPWEVGERAKYAVFIGIAIGIGWEIYELIGDRVFQSARIGGIWDTTNDLVSDTIGALSASYLLYRAEVGERGDVPTGST